MVFMILNQTNIGVSVVIIQHTRNTLVVMDVFGVHKNFLKIVVNDISSK